MIKIDKNERRKEVIEFLKKNPKATYRILKDAGYKHLERLFSKGLKEAYLEAKVECPRNFERKTRDERKKILIDYIKKHPQAGGQDIQKDTKINIKNAFDNTKEAFEAAGVAYPRENFLNLINRDKKERMKAVIDFLKKNPNSTLQEIIKKLKISPYKMFRNINEMYKKAGIKKIERWAKRAIRKKVKVIDFIRKNPQATQREINKNCKTRVQSLFNGGIFKAYEEAEVAFPFERLKLHGAATNDVKHRATCFEEEIAKRLSCYGKVNRLVRTKSGVADIIFERKDKKTVIEIKDYLNKEICNHEIKQLNRYLDDTKLEIGFIICHTKPQKDRFIINKNKIFILISDELDEILEIMDKE